MLFTLMLPTMLVPLAGLGIDATMLYIVQAKLSAAVDGAALGAGRLLGTLASPNEIASEFLNANFRTNGTMGFWGAFNLQPNISVTLGTTKTIKVSATADVPLLFARIFGFPKATVSAAATATRRDSRVILVIDRSGSMNTSDGAGSTVIADVVSYAQGFTQDFTSGVDELGLVVFDGSGVVGYPTVRPWDPTTTSTSTGGPDINFMNGSSTDMVHQIQIVNAANGTGMADALSVAYIELQKAHMRDLLAKGVDDKLNSIVLFTDGVPSAISMFLNNSSNNVLQSATNCANRTNGSTYPMYAWLSLGGSPPYGSSSGGWGLYQLASLDSTSSDTAQWWMKSAGQDAMTPETGANFAGCVTSNFQNSNSFSYSSYLSKIPSTDKYGNDMTGTVSGVYSAIYKNSAIVNGATNSEYNGTAFNASSVTSQYQWGLAMWNAAASAAYRARTDANLGKRPGDTQNMTVAIYSIGYTGNGGTDNGLLKIIANDKASAVYDATQPTGMYVQASDSKTLSTAFATIASAILRLAQ